MNARAVSSKHTFYTVQARGVRCLFAPVVLRQTPIVHPATAPSRPTKIAPSESARAAVTRLCSLVRADLLEWYAVRDSSGPFQPFPGGGLK